MNQLCILVTHLLNDTIINEYLKIEKSGYPTILLIDNTNNIVENLKPEKSYLTWKERKIRYLPFNENDLKNLSLPFCSFNEKSASYRDTLWYNSEYFFYLVHKVYPEYEYYWKFEYDCFYNDDNYINFFTEYNTNDSDLISFNIRKPQKNWSHIKNIDWLYPDSEDRLFTFFPCNRLSERSIKLLYKKRIEIYKKFLEKPNNTNWPHCELFVATEVSNANYTYSNLNNLGIFRYKPCLSREEQLNMKTKDSKLYHPVKQNFALDTIYI